MKPFIRYETFIGHDLVYSSLHQQQSGYTTVVHVEYYSIEIVYLHLSQ